MKQILINILRFVSLAIGMLIVVAGCSLLKPAVVNQTDQNGKKTGRWITFSSDQPKRKISDGYFKNDLETRRFRYYHPNGKRQVRFVYGRHHQYGKSHIKVKYWYPSGKVMQKGTSFLFLDEKEIRYVFDGEWRFYDERGRLMEKTVYKMGEPVLTKIYHQLPDSAQQ